MVMQATDIRLSLSDRADAIKFLLHLIADIHQPLHTGFAKDAGGVSEKSM
jgi:nuclease S1